MTGLQFVSIFQDLPDEQRPREKLAKYGPSTLHLWELIALILRTGTHAKHHSEDVMRLSKRVLAEGGFKGIFTQTDVGMVRGNFGVYKHHAEILVAVSEICRRLQGKYDVFDASEPAKIFQNFRFLQKAKQEQCFVLHLDEEKKCVYQEIVAIGSTDQVQVYPSDVLRTPIWLGTKTIIVVHNHPAHSKPSKEDISWTLALAKGALEFHYIKIVDHVIVGQDGYFSFLEKGLL